MKGIRNDWKEISSGGKDLPSIYEFAERPLDAGLWVLFMSKSKFGISFLTFGELEKILRDYYDLPLTILQLKRAFAKAGRRVIKSRQGNSYKISSTPGETYLKDLKSKGSINLLFMETDKLRSAKRDLKDLVNSIPKDDLLIFDPYYGLKTLDVLETFLGKHKSIKFLTSQLGNGERQSLFDSAYGDFKREHGNKLKIKKISTNDIHDRYIVAKNLFFIIGHGLKDLGNKESFVLGIADKYGKNIRETVRQNFLDRWGSADDI